MKKRFTFLTLFFMIVTAFSYGQEEINNTYRFVNPEMVGDTDNYVNAFSTANMTKFRYANKSNIIEFESGLKVELFSANKLISKGVSVDTSKILTATPLNEDEYVFDISANGKYILQRFTKIALKRN